MKAVFGWLTDPFLHLLVIGIVVVGFGSAMSRGTGKQDELKEDRCELCSRMHDDRNTCVLDNKAKSFAYESR